MNENEMIKDIMAIIDDRCEAELGQVHAESKGGKVTKTVSTSLIAKDIYNAGYRKVADDEIVIKRNVHDLEKAFYKEKCAEFDLLCYDYHKAKQETTREILQVLKDNIVNRIGTKYAVIDLTDIAQRAKENGIELEEKI